MALFNRYGFWMWVYVDSFDYLQQKEEKVSNTGTYIWREGRLVKISDEIPKLGYVTEAYLPSHKGRVHRPFSTAHVTGKEEEFTTRRDLYNAMKKNGVRYAESKPSRPSPDPKKIEKKVADKLTREASKRGFKWRE